MANLNICPHCSQMHNVAGKCPWCDYALDIAAKKERTDTCAECVRLQARIAELEATVKSLAFTVTTIKTKVASRIERLEGLVKDPEDDWGFK